MGKVKVYEFVDGQPIEEVVAYHTDVDRALRARAEVVEAKARAILAVHRDTGSSRIVMEKGDLDYHIVLEDPFAANIEFGRWLHNDETLKRHPELRAQALERTRSVAPLRRAAGLGVESYERL